MTVVGREENRETSMNISPEGGTVVVSPKEEGIRKGLGQIESADNFFEERGCGVCVPYEYIRGRG